MWLLLAKHTDDPGTHTRLPVAVSEKGYSVKWAGHRLVQECMPTEHPAPQLNVHGVLGVQHDGRVLGQSDGICFNTLVTLERSEDQEELDSPPLLDNERYTWREVTNQSTRDEIVRRIKDRALVPLHSL